MRADLDQEIDRAVREMLDAEPRPDLRARVLERIAEPRRQFPLRWVVLPVAAAALLLLAIAAPWLTSENAPFIRTSSLSQPVAAVRAPVPRAVNRSAIEPTEAVSAAARKAPVVRLASTEPPTQVRVAPLGPLDAIEVPPLSVTRLVDRQVAVAPLAPIEQIEIEPVGPPEGRN